jgi:hypothetical protein
MSQQNRWRRTSANGVRYLPIDKSGGRSAESISGGGEGVLPFRGLEEVADVPDLVPEGIDGPEGFCAEMGYKPCEGHFDRIEVRAMGSRPP